METVAVQIRTTDRVESLKACIDSIERHCTVPYRLYVADDGPESEAKIELYDRIRRADGIVKRFDEPIGVTAGRNRLLKELTDEAYVLRMDDDFCFCDETDLAAMIDVLQHDSTIGAVADLEIQEGSGKGLSSGSVSHRQGSMRKRGRRLIMDTVDPANAKWRYTGKGNRYLVCDFTRNMILLRREIFEDVRWDEDIIFEKEHLDFLLQIKASGWKLATCGDSSHLHADSLHPPSRKSQSRSESAQNVLERKWGVRDIEVRRPLGKRLVSSLKRHLVRLKKAITRSVQ